MSKSSKETNNKTIDEYLLEINRSGSVWMQDFIPSIKNAMKEWLTQKRGDKGDPEYGPYSCDECDAGQNMLDELLEDLKK